MEPFADTAQLQESLQGVVKLRHGSELHLLIPQMFRGELVDRFVYTSVLGGTAKLRHLCSQIIRSAALTHGIWCDSIHAFYQANAVSRGRSIVVPAFNIRGLTYSTIRSIFRVAQKTDSGPFIIEISPAEMSHTQQRADEIAACVLGAALRENYSGPVFLQGDHFRLDPRRCQSDLQTETSRLQALILDGMNNGFLNFDIDATIATGPDTESHSGQNPSYLDLAADLCTFIRHHQPESVSIALGVEFANLRGVLRHSQTLVSDFSRFKESLDRCGFPDHITKFNIHLDAVSGNNSGSAHTAKPQIPNVSADECAILREFAESMRAAYGVCGLEVHSSTAIPEPYLPLLPSSGVVEAHLGTRLQDVVFDHPRFPIGLTEEIHSYLETHCSLESRSGLPQEQFYYLARKKAWGPFKKAICSLDERTKLAILQDVEKEITMNFEKLGAVSQRKRMDEIYPVPAPSLAVKPRF